MRKAFVVLMFALVSTGLFAEYVEFEQFEWNTPEGTYTIQLYSVKNNSGQQTANDEIASDRSYCTVRAGIKLSTVELDLIGRALNNFKHRRGDTYVIAIYKDLFGFKNKFIVEYTSATQYNYWVWSYNGAPLHPPIDTLSPVYDDDLPPPVMPDLPPPIPSPY
jgi:hypothetical protein